MPEIPFITSREIIIGDTTIRTVPTYELNTTSQSIPYAPPVVVNIGVPIVDVPGCVEAHESNNKSKTVGSDDADRGLITYCDGTLPNFNPINFEPLQVLPTPVPKVDTRQEKEDKPDPPGQVNIPAPAPPSTANIQCPTPGQKAKEPVGSYVEGFRKKVTEYKLIGNECVQITEAVAIPQQIIAGLPSGGQVMQVGGVAVVATASALLAKPLADILLKAVKPTVKKVMKKIAKIRKKPIPVLSIGERRAEQRQMNHAVRELRSVFPRKKKRKG